MIHPVVKAMQSYGIDPACSIMGPFRLHVFLRQGRDLAAKDTCGKRISEAGSVDCAPLIPGDPDADPGTDTPHDDRPCRCMKMEDRQELIEHPHLGLILI